MPRIIHIYVYTEKGIEGRKISVKLNFVYRKKRGNSFEAFFLFSFPLLKTVYKKFGTYFSLCVYVRIYSFIYLFVRLFIRDIG